DLARAERLYRQCPDPQARLNLAEVLSRQGRHQEALAEVESLPRDTPALLQMGQVLLRMGRPAAAPLEEAVRRRESPLALNLLCQAYLAQGDPRRALEAARRAVALSAPEASLMFVSSHGNRGLAAARAGLLEEAELSLELAVQGMEALRGGPGDMLLLDREGYPLFDAAISAAVQRAHPDTAYRFVEQYLARTLLRAVSRLQAPRLAGVSPEALARLRVLEQRARELEDRLQGADPLRPGRPDAVQPVAADLQAVRAQRDALLEGLPRRYLELQNPRPLPLADLQAGLEPDEVALVYFLGQETSWLFVVRRDLLEHHALPGRAVLEDRARRLVFAASGGRIRARVLERAQVKEPVRQELGRMLFPPEVDWQARLGGRTLVIVPSGALLEIPFEVLPCPYGQHRFLVEAHPVAYAPSLTLLVQTREWARRRPAAPPRALVMADPGDIGALPPLPASRVEAEAIARILGAGRADVRLGSRASEAAFWEAPDGYGVLHFAVHGLLEEGPALALSPAGGHDGLLTAAEVLGCDLRCDLA
ncbi:MAG: CHAT domain-containing protein, partial [Candidatus Eremiobacterota bacterium]